LVVGVVVAALVGLIAAVTFAARTHVTLIPQPPF